MNTQIILSYGMGVESSALLVRWIREPDTCPVSLQDLLVVTSQVGNEYADTGADVETHVLPLLREHGIRFVQVARSGHLEKDGITILDDSRSPERIYLAGDYTLAQELVESGVVPQYGAEHLCSIKFKAAIITRLLDEQLDAAGPTIWAPSSARSRERTVQHIAFGFNADERKRAIRRKQYDTATRIGIFPLIDWGWTRDTCLDYLEATLGIRWKKSCCVFCPFARITEDLLARQVAHPDQVAEALLIEHLSLAMNPRGSLYRDRTLLEIVRRNANQAALDAFETRLAALKWALYRVRRVYRAKGAAQRAVERLAICAREADALAALQAQARQEHLPLETVGRIPYARFEHRPPDTYPAREGYYVSAPALVADKTRYGLDRFEREWRLPANLGLLV